MVTDRLYRLWWWCVRNRLFKGSYQDFLKTMLEMPKGTDPIMWLQERINNE